MNQTRRRILLTLLALGTGALPARATPLPFTLDDPDGHWRILAMQKDVTPDVTIEAVVIRPGAKMRYVILKSGKTDDGPAALRAAARRLKEVVVGNPGGNFAENAATAIGHDGFDQQFAVTNEKDTVTCDLFVFASERMWWGVLYVVPSGTPATAASPFELLHPRALASADTVEMTPFRAQDSPLTGFPIGLHIMPNLITGRIEKITVSEVPDNTTLQQVGVKVGDEILSIDHRKVQDFAIGLGKNSEIGKIFLNRAPGDEVELEIYFAELKKAHFVTLRVPSIKDYFRRGGP